MLNSHYDLDDSQFETLFANAHFPASLFNHEAHLRLAWIHLNKYTTYQSICNINEQLITYVESLGAAHKYNRTLTTAAIKVVEHFKNKSTSSEFESFIKEFPRLKNNFKDLLDQHYSFDIFQSVNAKEKYLLPDLLPFD